MTDPEKNDVFESDPFFSQVPGEGTLESDDLSFDAAAIEAEEVAPPPPVATAEERLLSSIVGEQEPETPETPSTDSSAEIASLQADLEQALAKTDSAIHARDQARQDLQILRTRFSTLESDLAAAREEAGKANQLMLQAEARHADSDRLWNDKLAQLRRMLDEVEEIRDEQLRKRVPKILFVGTLVAGVMATAFAYFIGASQAAREPVVETPPPVPHLSVAPPALPPIAAPARPAQSQILQPVNWPAIGIARCRTTETAQGMTVIFNYGVFTRGVELSSEARQDLLAIATAVKAKGNRFNVEVEGHTDPAKAGAKTHGGNNNALGLARAQAAASYLVKTGGLPASSVTTSSAGESNPPFPNTTQENQKKNRTVVLKITSSTARSP